MEPYFLVLGMGSAALILPLNQVRVSSCLIKAMGTFGSANGAAPPASRACHAKLWHNFHAVVVTSLDGGPEAASFSQLGEEGENDSYSPKTCYQVLLCLKCHFSRPRTDGLLPTKECASLLARSDDYDVGTKQAPRFSAIHGIFSV